MAQDESIKKQHLQTESEIEDKCRADLMYWNATHPPDVAADVTVVLDWDSGPYPHFFEKTAETTLYGRRVALVPVEIWARYKRLCAEVFDLENVITELSGA